jgi:RNA polymerase sigma-70 factor (ECF subfamily)
VLVEEAFKENSEAMVRAMVYFSRDEQTADDAVSQAFAQAWANKELLEDMPEPAMKAWLYAAARNAVVDIKRRENRLSYFSEDNPIGELADASLPDLTDRAAAESLMSGLPPELHEPVRLKYFENLNATEIGRVMKLPPATVRTRLRSAIRNMRENYHQGEKNE